MRIEISNSMLKYQWDDALDELWFCLEEHFTSDDDDGVFIV